MDWSKVDAGLAGALTDAGEGDRFDVFVHLVTPIDRAAVDEVGIDGLDPSGEGVVRTAVVVPAEIDRLSEQPWVSHLRLSRTLPPPDRP